MIPGQNAEAEKKIVQRPKFCYHHCIPSFVF